MKRSDPGTWSADVARDVRYALRALRRAPAYTAVVVLTLALGIGAASTAQGVIDPLLLRPLAFAQPERLVTLDGGVLQGEYGVMRERVAAFERLSLYMAGQAWGIAGDGAAERVTGAAVTPDFFVTLGVDPLRGSVAVDDAATPAVVLSYGLWMRRFGGDASAVGRSVRLDGRALPVVAVMRPGFDYPSHAQLWLVEPVDAGDVGAYWGSGGYRVVGRLRAGATTALAEAEIRGLSATFSAANPLWTPAADYRADVRVVSLHEAIVGDVRTALLLLGGAVALLLLIACANVANLVLARGLERSRELAVRTALGASGGRLVRQLLTETIVLAGAGGAAGVALAYTAVAALRRVLPADLPRATEIGIDLRVLAASVVVTLATGLLLGVLPARRARRFHLQPALRDGSRSMGDRSTRQLSGALVVTQVAFAVLLVTGAALLVRSLTALQRVDTGIGRMDVVTARIDLPAAQYAAASERNVFYDELLRRTAALPGVRDVALTSQLPFSGEYQASAMAVEHVTTDPNDLPIFIHRRVTPGFFDALGIPLRRGRSFVDSDATEGMAVAIIDEAAARRFWPDQDPIGRRLGRPWMNELRVVVGVVGSVLDGELADQAEPTVYTPLAQEPPASAFIAIHSATGTGVLPALRAVVRDVDASVPMSDAGTVSTLVGNRLSAQRLSTSLLGMFGILALILAAVGIYGVLAYAVGQRTREFALRLALGARARDIAAIVLREGGTLVALGALLGTVAALLLSRVIGGLLYGVSPTDPPTLLAVAAIVLLTAAIAALVPAHRASRLQPMQAMRE